MGNFIVAWIARNATESTARRGIISGLFVYDAIGFVITLIALLDATPNTLGWSICGLGTNTSASVRTVLVQAVHEGEQFLQPYYGFR